MYIRVTKGAMLRFGRELAGLTQERAAGHLHCDRATISRAESDRATVLNEYQAWELYGGLPMLQRIRDAAEATILRMRAMALQPV